MGVARIFMKRCTKMGGYSMFHTSRKGREMISSVDGTSNMFEGSTY